jgi:MATE family multidrug resistance protein
MARLAAPIVLVNVGLMLQGTVDTLMLGRVSPAALASSAVGNLYFYNVVVVGMGLVMSLDPIVAQALGAEDRTGVSLGVQRGVLLACVASIFAMGAMAPAASVLGALQQPHEIIAGASAYVRWSMIGALPWLLFTAFRQTLQAMHRVLPMAAAVFVSNGLNAFLNWVFVFGHLGFEPMGIVGAAHATWISRWIMLGLLLWFGWRDLSPSLRPWLPSSTAVRPLLRMAALGLPVGLQMFAEAFAFGFVGLAIGWVGTIQLAGHQIALQLASVTFMVPFGVAGAGAAMVGRAIGRGDMAAARRDALAALACGVGFMALMAMTFLTFPGTLARWFTPDLPTIGVVLVLLPIAGFFQVFDGLQVVSASILRGAGDTRVPMLIHVLSFWALGIPLGLVLAFPLGKGAAGLWWGLTGALASAALLQLARVRSHLARDVRRATVD